MQNTSINKTLQNLCKTNTIRSKIINGPYKIK